MRENLGPKSKKALAYMRRMISTGHWEVNSKIPHIVTIASLLNVSPPTVRKAIRVLEDQKVIVNYDFGFFVLSDILIRRNKKSRVSDLLMKASSYLNATKGIHNDYKIINSYAIKVEKEPRRIKAINLITSNEISSSIDELFDVIDNPVSLKTVINDNAKISKYKRQKELYSLAKLVCYHKRELGIDGLG